MGWPMAKPMEYTQGDILFINEVPFMQPLFDTCAELFKAHRYTECIRRLSELVRTAQTRMNCL